MTDIHQESREKGQGGACSRAGDLTNDDSRDNKTDNYNINNNTHKEQSSYASLLSLPLNVYLGATTEIATTIARTNNERDRPTETEHTSLESHAVLEPEEKETEKTKRSPVVRNRKSRSGGSQDGCDRVRHCQDGTISDNQNDASNTPSVLLDVAEGTRRLSRGRTEDGVNLRQAATTGGDAGNGTSPSSSPAPTLVPLNPPPLLPIFHVDKNQYLWPTTTTTSSPPPPPSPSSSVNTAFAQFTNTTVTTPGAYSVSAVTLSSFIDQVRQQDQEEEQEGRLTRSHKMDKGRKAWSVVLASVLIQTFAFAPTEFIFGVFVQEYLNIFPTASPSSIALIGTIGSSTTFLVGFFSGAFSDRWGYRVTSVIGSLIMTAALCLASFATKLWHLYVSQGILFGVGASLVYFSAIAAPTHWFEKKRGLAMGIAASGSGLGGFFLAPLTQFLIDRFEVWWTLRALGVYSLVICGGASLLLFERDKSDREQRWNEEKQYRKETGQSFVLPEYTKGLPFATLVVFQFVLSMSYLTPIYFMELYSTHIGISKQMGAVINGWFNGASFVARIVTGLLADLVAADVLLLVCSWSSTLAILVLWTFSKSFPVYLFFAIVYGITFSGITTVTPVIVANQYGPRQVSGVLGIVYGFSCLALVAGSFISGHILELTRSHIEYFPVIMYSGSMFAVSALFATTWYMRTLT
ncbi:MAG: major facilitator superfamily domain-containing protein [Linnemannia elongata]|nr:MAG: major facilitator superfamily domain-containing protein [Linnemannia elongata]